MIQARQHLRLALESRHPLGIFSELIRQHLERHLATELGVFRAPHLAHPASAKLVGDTVVQQRRADHLRVPQWRSSTRLHADLRATQLPLMAPRAQPLVLPLSVTMK